MKLRRGITVVLAAVAAALGLHGPAAGEVTPAFAWVQWEFDGRAHVRAIAAGGCPVLTVGARAIPLELRSGPQQGFPDSVCDAVYPRDAMGGRVGSLPIPALPRAPKHIVVFGDTGCRVQGLNLQACNDPAKWPMPAIARAMAAEHPDLVIHVGDYYYRETACPPLTPVDCSNSPYGDNAASWKADWFVPAAPLFATAPLVLVRGNHEDCNRAPLGWARYLSGLPGAHCSLHEDPAYVAFDNLILGNVDSAYGDENASDPYAFERDEQQVDIRAASLGRETWVLTHKPPVGYLKAHRTNDVNGAHLAAILSGHIHVFGEYTFPGAPPQLIHGTGGDLLETDAAKLAPLGGITEAQFGYAIYDRVGDGWNVTIKGVDGAIRHRCRLAARQVSCSP